MSRSPELERKLAVLMSLAADDREGLPPPPRLRHAADVGALGPINIRAPAAGARRADVAAAHSDDQRVQLSTVTTARCVATATCRAPCSSRRSWCGSSSAPARAAGASGLFVTTGIPGRPVKVMDDLITVLELLRERAPVRRVHPREAGARRRARADRAADRAGEPGVGQPRGAVRGQPGADRAGEELRHDGHPTSHECAAQLLAASGPSGREGKPRDALHPGGASGMTMQFVVGATPDTDRTLLGKVTEL